MPDIFTINADRVFNLEEAENVLPIVLKITRTHSEKVKSLVERIDVEQKTSGKDNWQLEQEINQHIDSWKAKMQKLGINPRGLWIGDFPSVDGGYFCWKYPEASIKYWHSKQDGYSKRKVIQQTKNIDSLDGSLKSEQSL